MQQNDRAMFKRMAVGFLLVCLFSAIMQKTVFSKTANPKQHYEPVYTQSTPDPETQFLPSGPPSVGTVAAVSFDKFYLMTTGGRQTFLVGQLRMPVVGDKVRVSFAQGRPPTALKIERLSPESP